MRLLFTDEAERDLSGIIDYIAIDSPNAAENIYRAIRAAADQLRDFPAMGHPGRLAGTRELPVVSLPYVIVYRVDEEAVTIVAIFHAARDLIRALDERNKQLKSRAKPRPKRKS